MLSHPPLQSGDHPSSCRRALPLAAPRSWSWRRRKRWRSEAMSSWEEPRCRARATVVGSLVDARSAVADRNGRGTVLWKVWTAVVGCHYWMLGSNMTGEWCSQSSVIQAYLMVHQVDTTLLYPPYKCHKPLLTGLTWLRSRVTMYAL